MMPHGQPNPAASQQAHNQPQRNEAEANAVAQSLTGQARLASLQSQANPLALQNQNGGGTNSVEQMPLAASQPPATATPPNQAVLLAMQQKQMQCQAFMKLMQQKQREKATQSVPQNVATPPVTAPGVGTPGLSPAQINQQHSSGRALAQTSLTIQQQQQLMEQAKAAAAFQAQMQQQQQQTGQLQQQNSVKPPAAGLNGAQIQQVGASLALNQGGVAASTQGQMPVNSQQQQLSAGPAPGPAALALKQQQQQVLIQQTGLGAALQAQIQQQQQQGQNEVALPRARPVVAPNQQQQGQRVGQSSPSLLSLQQQQQRKQQTQTQEQKAAASVAPGIAPNQMQGNHAGQMNPAGLSLQKQQQQHAHETLMKQAVLAASFQQQAQRQQQTAKAHLHSTASNGQQPEMPAALQGHVQRNQQHTPLAALQQQQQQNISQQAALAVVQQQIKDLEQIQQGQQQQSAEMLNPAEKGLVQSQEPNAPAQQTVPLSQQRKTGASDQVEVEASQTTQHQHQQERPTTMQQAQRAVLQAQIPKTLQKSNQLPFPKQSPVTEEGKEGQSLRMLVNMEKWELVLELLKHNPSHFMIGQHASVLHAAIAKRAWRYVKDLLELVPTLSSICCTIVPSQAPLPPIHMATSSPAPAETEKEVFGAYLDAIARIAAGNVSALNIRNQKGRTPLHQSIESELPEKVSIALLGACPAATKTGDATGYLPLHTLLAKKAKHRQLLRLLVDTYPESVVAKVPTKNRDGSISSRIFESAETILMKYADMMSSTDYNNAKTIILGRKAQIQAANASPSSNRHTKGGIAAGEEQGTPSTRLNEPPVPAVSAKASSSDTGPSKADGHEKQKLDVKQAASEDHQKPKPVEPSAQQGGAQSEFEQKEEWRAYLQKEYDEMKAYAMKKIETMQKQGVDIRKAIQSVNGASASSMSGRVTAGQAAGETSKAARYQELLTEKKELQRLAETKNQSGKQMFEKLTRSREAYLNQKNESFKHQLTRMRTKHEEQLKTLQMDVEEKQKDIEFRGAKAEQSRSEIERLERQLQAAENDVKHQRRKFEVLNVGKKRKMESLLRKHKEEIKRDRLEFFSELNALYNQLEEKREHGQESQEGETEGQSAGDEYKEQDDPACTLIMQLREDIASLEGTVDQLLKRQRQGNVNCSDVDDEADEDDVVNVVDSDDEDVQPFSTAADDLENEFGICERS